MVQILGETCVELLLALSCEALLESVSVFEGGVAPFEVTGTLARLAQCSESRKISTVQHSHDGNGSDRGD